MADASTSPSRVTARNHEAAAADGRDRPAPQPPDKDLQKPWRSEGVPATDGDGQRPKRRVDWKWLIGMLVGYLWCLVC